MRVCRPGPEGTIIGIPNDLALPFPHEPLMFAECFLHAGLHLRGTDHLSFKGNDRMENVPIINLGNSCGVSFCGLSNMHIFTFRNNSKERPAPIYLLNGEVIFAG